MIMLSSKESTRQHHIHLNKNTWVHKSAVKCHYLTILTHIFSFIIHHSMEHFNNIRDIHYYSTDWSHFVWHEDIICIINACLQSFTIEVEISNALAWSGAELAFTVLNEIVKILISFIEQLFGYIEQSAPDYNLVQFNWISKTFFWSWSSDWVMMCTCWSDISNLLQSLKQSEQHNDQQLSSLWTMKNNLCQEPPAKCSFDCLKAAAHHQLKMNVARHWLKNYDVKLQTFYLNLIIRW